MTDTRLKGKIITNMIKCMEKPVWFIVTKGKRLVNTEIIRKNSRKKKNEPRFANVCTP